MRKNILLQLSLCAAAAGAQSGGGASSDRACLEGFANQYLDALVCVNVPGQCRHDMPTAAKRPFGVDVAEAFKIRCGKTRKVEPLMTALKYGAKSPFVPE